MAETYDENIGPIARSPRWGEDDEHPRFGVLQRIKAEYGCSDEEAHAILEHMHRAQNNPSGVPLWMQVEPQHTPGVSDRTYEESLAHERKRFLHSQGEKGWQRVGNELRFPFDLLRLAWGGALTRGPVGERLLNLGKRVGTHAAVNLGDAATRGRPLTTEEVVWQIPEALLPLTTRAIRAEMEREVPPRGPGLVETYRQQRKKALERESGAQERMEEPPMPPPSLGVRREYAPARGGGRSGPGRVREGGTGEAPGGPYPRRRRPSRRGPGW